MFSSLSCVFYIRSEQKVVCSLLGNVKCMEMSFIIMSNCTFTRKVPEGHR